MWEAIQHAGWEGLDNLVAIIDVNRLGQTRETMLGWDLDGYVRRIEAFGWNAIAIDGHDVDAIEAAYAEAEATEGRPTAIVARTKKGKGVKAVEDQPGKHGKPLDDPDEAIAELGGERDLSVELAEPVGGEPHVFETPGGELPTLGARRGGRHPQGLRRGAGRARRRSAATSSRSTARSRTPPTPRTSARRTRTATSRCSSPSSSSSRPRSASRCAAGCRSPRRSRRSFARVRLRPHGARSRARTCASRGSHAGVSIGEDGPSQMALEDIATIRAIHGSTVLHPSDANQAAALVAAMADTRRASRSCARCAGRPRCARRPARTSAIGGSRVAREGDDVAIVACGITLDEAVAPPRRSRASGVSARVLDCYSIKPIDAEAVRAAARECGAIVTVEDHGPRAAWATRCSRRSPTPTTARGRSSSRCARCRARARRRSCCTRPASTPRRSPPRRAASAQASLRFVARRRRPPGAARRRGRCTGTGRPPRGRPRSPPP